MWEMLGQSSPSPFLHLFVNRGHQDIFSLCKEVRCRIAGGRVANLRQSQIVNSRTEVRLQRPSSGRNFSSSISQRNNFFKLDSGLSSSIHWEEGEVVLVVVECC
ncbi:unnamed protein product [Linum tenue]|uniref:Uncharacterized protein n=1 Tax=Linum tenue TaxID=586396 RepID=A0AAV0REH5_9ROSI|nr:unnamed protein product [Linum tenue]